MLIKKGVSLGDRITGTLFLLPTIGILFFTSLYPLGYALVLSFFNLDYTKSKEMSFIGFQNYVYAFKDKAFLYSLAISIVFVIVTIAIEFIAGLVIALLLAREGKRLRIARSIILIPMVMAPVVIGVLWRILYNPDSGLINYFLSLLHIPIQQWLSDPNLALVSVMITDIWEWTPFVILCFVAALTSLPQEAYEAAMIDGANTYQTLRYVILPMLKPAIIVTMLMRTLDGFKIIDSLYVMTYGGPGDRTKLLSFFIYERGMRYFQIGYASAVSWIFLIFMFIFTFYLIRQRQKSEQF